MVQGGLLRRVIGELLRLSGGSNTQTTCAAPTATANTPTAAVPTGDLTPVGSYTGSASPYGTFDQGGNVWEWNEAIIERLAFRGIRGGSFDDPLDASPRRPG